MIKGDVCCMGTYGTKNKKGEAMDFLDKRVMGICNELKKLKVKQKFPITKFQYKEGNFIHPVDAEADSHGWQAFDAHTMRWYGPDRHY